MYAALGDVEFNHVAGTHQSKRPSDEAFRSHVKNASAVARAAHPSIRNADHIANTPPAELLGDRQHAPFGHARPPLRACVLEDQDVIGSNVEILAVDRGGHL